MVTSQMIQHAESAALSVKETTLIDQGLTTPVLFAVYQTNSQEEVALNHLVWASVVWESQVDAHEQALFKVFIFAVLRLLNDK